MTKTTFHAMGTTIELLLPDERSATATVRVEQLFAEWEGALTRFQPTSELAGLNRHAGVFVFVSPLLCDVLAAALAAARATDGIYDPALLVQLCQAGYDRTFAEVAREQPESGSLSKPGGAWHAITLDPVARCVFVPPGVQIDLGGIAKGMAVDAALALLRAEGVTCALVNAGGDLGVIGLPPEQDHWPVAVPDGTVVRLERGALATSGKTGRYWRQGDQERHHLIDPRTGMPAQTDLQTATVAANHCEQAEIAAKVAFILGSAAGLAFLGRHQLQGVLALEDGTQLTTDGWPHATKETR
jgi:thiamine biosynthesis lipoprotein